MDNEAAARTTPDKWAQVLGKYGKLKLDLAHLGKQENRFGLFPVTDWRRKVVDLVRTYDNVYTDFSCAAFTKDYYDFLERIVKDNHLEQKVLFGSDYMINLMWSRCYNDYLKLFMDSKLSKSLKERLCNKNPEAFLFG